MNAQAAVTELRGIFQDDKTCVIHGDLHHGSVMVDTAASSADKVCGAAGDHDHARQPRPRHVGQVMH